MGENLLPLANRVASLLKRWLLGTHQGAVSAAHLDYYLDEYTFRFNRIPGLALDGNPQSVGMRAPNLCAPRLVARQLIQPYDLCS